MSNFLIALLIGSAYSANILYVSHIASPSHHIWNRALALGLAEKGHNVTMLTHDKEKGPVPKTFHLILLEGFYDLPYEEFDMDVISVQNPFESMVSIYDWSQYCCEHDFKTKGLKTLLDYPKEYKFDLIIYDVTLGQCHYPLIERFHNPPVIGTTPFLLPPVLSYAFGNPLETAYMPYFSTTYMDRMNFMERLWNTIYIYAEVLYRKYFGLPNEMKIAREYYGKNIRPFEEVERNISILLSNFDPVLMFPLDLPQNIIPVGGLQVAPPKPLPQDLQKVIDEAKDGVILFTLGSNLRSDRLSPSKRKSILNAFSKLSQTVLWKFETDNVEGFPKNVIVRKWLPQSDILGNPNTKLFISHGGGLGSHEAMYHGVPVVTIPFFVDHHANAGRLEKRKLSKTVNFLNLTEENLYDAITEVLNNPIYTQNMKALSSRYRDQPQTPLERSIFWVEYVLRHGGAEHLVLAARDMPFYQTLCLDILAVFVLGVILIYALLLLIFTVLKATFLLVFPKKSNTRR